MEAMGLALPNNAAFPAVDSRRSVLAHMAGRQIVEMVRHEIGIASILTRKAFENAIVVNAAIGGSTNAVVHLLAIAGRLGIPLNLHDWDRIGRDVPCLVNLMPSGDYLMEDFCYAGGLPAVMKELGALLHGDAPTISGLAIAENIKSAECYNRNVIASIDRPFKKHGGIAVLRGNLAPNGAVIKPSAATPSLMQHRGKAIVFEDIDDYKSRIDDPNLEVDPTDILVLKNCGPKGYPGFPEVGNMSIPLRLIRQGITDMVRISDARMSGTAYGTVVLHVSPEAAVGGPLALVRNGDVIELDVAERRLELMVAEKEIKRRQERWVRPAPHMERGWYRLYHEHVLQADSGADFDFLVGASGAPIPRECD
jgi:dihydroxy-acid dehydratase